MVKIRSVVTIILLSAAFLVGARLIWTSYASVQVKAAVQSQAPAASKSSSIAPGDWAYYNGNQNGNHYSPLKQIDKENVSKLKVAWTFDTKEAGGLETNPLVLGGVVYGVTPSRKVIALDGATGKLLWTFDSGVRGRGHDRGLSYWEDGQDRRLLVSVGYFLYAINLSDGKPIPSFGEDGRVDMRKGLGRDYTKQSLDMSSPGIVYKDVIIVGDGMSEDYPAPPGDIRAYNIRTGNQQWIFHTIPHPGEFGYDTWPQDAWKTAGAGNNWAGMSLDAERGIVYIPTGSAVPDMYGADRLGDDLFTDTLLALNAETGERIWYFQGVHHDVWDRDFPSPPALLTVTRDGKKVDAIAQTTKAGFIYLFDRANGKPLFPIVEKPVPASTVPGEVVSKTQPWPSLPLPFARQVFTRDMVTNRTPEAHEWALKQYDRYISQGQFIPHELGKVDIMLPGTGGGAEWGGPAIDPASGVLYVNSNEMPRLYSLVEPPPPGSEGQQVYQDNCSSCHGVNRAGAPPEIPSLLGIQTKLSDDDVKQTVRQGKGRMPPFTGINDQQVSSLLQYLKSPPGGRGGRGGGEGGPAAAASTTAGAEANGELVYPKDKIRTVGSLYFLDPDGYPAVVPPWGTFSAIDMNTGKYLWKIPFGEYPALAAQGLHNTGSQNYGGPILTASGILFIGASIYDHKFHAFDAKTGKLLWEDTMPFSASATPATYLANGKQFVVVAAGGTSYCGCQTGGVYVAYALP